MFKSFNLSRSAKGFTLIELLVVIAIIGILASVVLVSLNGARAKGRDAKRLAELQQIARAIQLADADPAVAFAVCTAVYSDLDTCTVSGNSLFTNFQDPSTPGTPCPLAPTGTCQYSVTNVSGAANPTTQSWQVKTYLEGAAGSLAAGETCISSNNSTPFQGASCI